LRPGAGGARAIRGTNEGKESRQEDPMNPPQTASQSAPQIAARFRATAGAHQGFGDTPRAALDALLSCLPPNGAAAAAPDAPIVIWPYNRGDAFFSDAQQARLQELKQRGPETLTPAEQEEWDRLIEAAFDATIARTQAFSPAKR